jgi:hypothetical protein
MVEPAFENSVSQHIHNPFTASRNRRDKTDLRLKPTHEPNERSQEVLETTGSPRQPQKSADPDSAWQRASQRGRF